MNLFCEDSRREWSSAVDPRVAGGAAQPLAHADLSETKENIKQDTKEAARKTGHAAKEAGHATANAARAVGHGVKNAAHATKCGVKHVFKKPCESD